MMKECSVSGVFWAVCCGSKRFSCCGDQVILRHDMPAIKLAVSCSWNH